MFTTRHLIRNRTINKVISEYKSIKMRILFSALLLISSIFIYAQIDTLVDIRDGKIYKITKIGQNVWMAENLDFKTEKSYCYSNKVENCETYGRLYRWEAATKACPEGWHLPSEEEWQSLEKELGMSETELVIENNWRGKDQANLLVSDSIASFNMLFGGYRNPPSNYYLEKMQAFFWTANEVATHAWYRQMRDGSGQIFRKTRPKSWAMSVRCVKD